MEIYKFTHSNYVIVSPSGQVHIYDGSYHWNWHRIMPVMRDLIGESRLESIVISHYDRDHVGGLGSVISCLAGDVKAVYSSGMYSNEAANEERRIPVEKAIQRYSIPHIFTVAGDTIADDVLDIQVIAPLAQDLPTEPPDWVDISNTRYDVAVKYSYGDFSILLTADKSYDALNRVATVGGYDVTATIGHSPHHGDPDMVSEDLVDLIQPELMIVESGSGVAKSFYEGLDIVAHQLFEEREQVNPGTPVDGPVKILGNSDGTWSLEPIVRPTKCGRLFIGDLG